MPRLLQGKRRELTFCFSGAFYPHQLQAMSQSYTIDSPFLPLAARSPPSWSSSLPLLKLICSSRIEAHYQPFPSEQETLSALRHESSTCLRIINSQFCLVLIGRDGRQMLGMVKQWTFTGADIHGPTHWQIPVSTVRLRGYEQEESRSK